MFFNGRYRDRSFHSSPEACVDAIIDFIAREDSHGLEALLERQTAFVVDRHDRVVLTVAFLGTAVAILDHAAASMEILEPCGLALA